MELIVKAVFFLLASYLTTNSIPHILEFCSNMLQHVLNLIQLTAHFTLIIFVDWLDLFAQEMLIINETPQPLAKKYALSLLSFTKNVTINFLFYREQEPLIGTEYYHSLYTDNKKIFLPSSQYPVIILGYYLYHLAQLIKNVLKDIFHCLFKMLQVVCKDIMALFIDKDSNDSTKRNYFIRRKVIYHIVSKNKKDDYETTQQPPDNKSQQPLSRDTSLPSSVQQNAQRQDHLCNLVLAYTASGSKR
ncbi:hypothetical protein EBR43_07765 [bacterium]|nr:hypothetical protein [bacterium]NBW57664.1 hypothetical protein [bacterium]NBX71780.1 hypothetical protein [bacterium]